MDLSSGRERGGLRDQARARGGGSALQWRCCWALTLPGSWQCVRTPPRCEDWGQLRTGPTPPGAQECPPRGLPGGLGWRCPGPQEPLPEAASVESGQDLRAAPCAAGKACWPQPLRGSAASRRRGVADGTMTCSGGPHPSALSPAQPPQVPTVCHQRLQGRLLSYRGPPTGPPRAGEKWASRDGGGTEREVLVAPQSL